MGHPRATTWTCMPRFVPAQGSQSLPSPNQTLHLIPTSTKVVLTYCAILLAPSDLSRFAFHTFHFLSLPIRSQGSAPAFRTCQKPTNPTVSLLSIRPFTAQDPWDLT